VAPDVTVGDEELAVGVEEDDEDEEIPVLPVVPVVPESEEPEDVPEELLLLVTAVELDEEVESAALRPALAPG
jgi:hypothetical protein